ncbi:hypothetical protein SASPL_146749 [Salvia splendens]|uniref:Uncharacterized protein n=1 Tax=Salvia splendens TaxID=180675 RepID=A0A8X8WD90_SALSN|nr:hypothetical protein SASPL_146749 [Salvia splendens]
MALAFEFDNLKIRSEENDGRSVPPPPVPQRKSKGIRWRDDPFLAALKSCTKEEKNLSKKSFFFSCKHSCNVQDNNLVSFSKLPPIPKESSAAHAQAHNLGNIHPQVTGPHRSVGTPTESSSRHTPIGSNTNLLLHIWSPSIGLAIPDLDINQTQHRSLSIRRTPARFQTRRSKIPTLNTSYMSHQRVWSPPDCIFQPLPQPPQPHCCQNAAYEVRCIGEIITHAHSPNLDECLDSYVCGYAHELRGQDEDDSSSSSFVAPIGYSCEVTRDFDYYSKHRTVEEEHCENLGSVLLMDSKSETEVEDVCGDGASNLDATGVSILSIALLGEKLGVEEDRAVSPADHQVLASKEIYWSCSSDVNNILSTAPLPASALLSDVDGDFKCLLQGHLLDDEGCIKA